MKCYFHPEEEGVVTCAGCGVAMCKECESTAFYRTTKGKGQAFCKNCSLEVVKTDVKYQSKRLIISLLKLIVCSIFIIAGLVAFLNDSFAFVFWWAVAGVIFGVKGKKQKDSTDSIAMLAMFSGNDGAAGAGLAYFIFKFVLTVIGYMIAGPVIWIVFAIKLIVDFVKYKKEKDWLNSLQSTQSTEPKNLTSSENNTITENN